MKKYNNTGLKYVEAYDKIIKIIEEMGLKEGDCIPSENKLKESFGLSRGTIRQAIALMKEDGIIYNHKGKGNILINSCKNENKGLDNISTPIFDFNNAEYTNVEVTIELQPASNKMKEFLKRENDFIVILINVKYYIGKEIVSLLMYFLDYEDVKEYNFNIKTAKELREFIDNYMRDNVVKSEMNFQCFSARSSIANKMNMEEGKPLLYFSEVMKDASAKVIYYRRSYFRPDYFKFSLIRK